MKKEEKTELTKNRIINAALIEFSENGFNGFVINRFCSKYKISKGILYHNFSGKNDLYFECIRESFQKAISYIKGEDDVPNLIEYMYRRHQFLEEYPYHSKIFFKVLLSSPSEFDADIRKVRETFIEFNKEVSKKLIQESQLKKYIKENEAVDYLTLIQEMFRSYFYFKNYTEKNLDEVIIENKKLLMKALDFMLYGIFEKE